MHKMRIGTLDSFRTIAILSVILFHFFSLDDFRYSYGNKYDFFWQGRYGVDFFFIISGFVIFHTLENTSTLSKFLKNRAIRLYPSAIIASTITLIVVLLLTNERVGSLLIKYLASITLINPGLLHHLFVRSSVNLSYLDGSFWSLWPEIQFYIVAGIIYYINADKFLKHFTLISLILIGLFWLDSNILGSNYLNLNQHGLLQNSLYSCIGLFNLPVYIVYFALGTQFYVLYKYRHEGKIAPWWSVILIALFGSLQIYFAVTFSTRVTNICMLLLFLLFIYFPKSLRIIDNSLFRRIGVSSYFLYLIHQTIGFVLLEKFGKYILPNSFVFPAMVLVLFIIISIIYTFGVEKPILRALKTIPTKTIKPT